LALYARTLWTSLKAAAGDIVFGIEDSPAERGLAAEAFSDIETSRSASPQFSPAS
jgi:hypothetical protein